MNGFQNLKRTRLDPAETNFNEYDDLYDDLYDDDYEKDFKILRGLFSTPLRQTSTFEKAPLRSAFKMQNFHISAGLEYESHRG